MNVVKIPEKSNEIELEVNKSRFIALAEPLADHRNVRNRIREIRDSHHGCTHVVYAFFSGDDRSQSGFSDDGEPHGTAGRPVYEVLKGSGLTDILLSVTRYFGGTKLGTGGLVSAYGQAAKDVLVNLPLKDKIYTIPVRMDMEYRYFEQVKKLLIEAGTDEIIDDFSTRVSLYAQIPRESRDELLQKISDISRGEIKPEFPEEDKN